MTVARRSSLVARRSSLDQDVFLGDVARGSSTPTVAVALAPGAVLLDWAGDVEAVLAIFLGGGATGDAVAAVLFGDHNPSAKSPVTFPVAEVSDVSARAARARSRGWHAQLTPTRAAARNRDVRGRHQRERGRRVDARRGRVHDAHDPRVDAGVRARRTALDAVEHLT